MVQKRLHPFIPLEDIADDVDEHWPVLRRLVAPGAPGRGRPRCDERKVLIAVLYVLLNDVPWAAIPQNHPSARTCQRRFQEWWSTGALVEIGRVLGRRRRLASVLRRRGYFTMVPPPH